MFERFTDRSRKVLAFANQSAQAFNHEYFGPEHVLLGLIREGSGVACTILKNRGIELSKISSSVRELLKNGPEMVTMGRLPQTPQCKELLNQAILSAKSIDHNYVGTEHLLLALLSEPLRDSIPFSVLNRNFGLDAAMLKQDILNLLKTSTGPGRTVPYMTYIWNVLCEDHSKGFVIADNFDNACNLARDRFAGVESVTKFGEAWRE